MRIGEPILTRTRRGFTLVEVLIVITILGIVATIVIPQFSTASETARDNTLKDEMRYLRTQLAVYKAQHNDRAAGYPGGVVTAAPTEAALLAQMTLHTDEIGNTSATGSATYKYGPYLSKLPANPRNGLSTIKMIANGAAMPAADGSTGFIYKAQTQEIIPNLAGVDAAGVAYGSY